MNRNTLQEKSTENAFLSFGKNSDHVMIAFSLRGKSHLKNNMPLQDWHALRVLPNGWSLAVICDGVGSKPFADEGAKVAANAFADFVVRFFGSYQDAKSVLTLLKCAAHYATGKISQAAHEKGRDIHDYSTTLHAAIFANGIIYYFHSGDGGAISLTEDGSFERITEPQKEDEYVIPLLAGPEAWTTGISKSRAQSVLLCTDGLYNKLAGSVLKKYGEGIDKGICTFFLNPWCFENWENPETILNQMKLVFSDEAQPNDFYQTVARGVAQGQKSKEQEASSFVRDWIYADNYPLNSLQGIEDDITMVLIQNTAERPSRQPMEAMKGPEWEKIRQQVYQDLYG